MEKKKMYIISLLLVGIVIITGTFAWLTWKSNETSLVLTVGDINNVQVVLKPYQISKEIIPVLTYTSEEYTEVSVVNNSSSSNEIKLYYHVNSIDSELISSDFLYTIEKSTDGGTTYTEYLSGNFSSATDDSNLYIMEEIIPKNTSYKYRVYLWLDGSSSGQGSIQGKKFSGELRAELDSVNNIIVDLSDGLIPITYDVSGSNTIVKTISSDDENWYDYNNKEWANAVLVSNGTTSSSVYDLSGNNTENTLNGASLLDEGLSFDGVDDYVLLPQYSVSSMSNGFAMEVKFKLDSIPSDTEVAIFSNVEVGGSQILITKSGLLQMCVYSSGYICTGSVMAEINKEYVVTGIYDKNNVKFYMNGQLISSLEVSGELGDPNKDTHYVLGCNPKGTTCQLAFFNGIIYQARMYNKALSDIEVLNNYNGNIAEDNLLFNFDFVDGKRLLYKNTSDVIIPEDDILAYYVYVPRYKYKIWTTELSSSGSEQEIEIIFENKDTVKSTGTQVDEYITHPAFTFGNTEVNGIWVGKFETGGTAIEPLIKPNISSLRSQTVSEEFTTAQIFGTSTYGMTSNVDAHMIKNSEWGAVSYLSHSRYGVNREIYINNSSGYYTGRSGGNVGGSTAINTVYTDQTATTQYNTYGFYTWDGYLLEYDTNMKSSTRDLTKVASTTGNITGVYDMSGGAMEHVMGVLADNNDNPRSGSNTFYNSGYNGMLSDGAIYTAGVNFPNSKYYDLYTSTDSSSSSASLSLTACNGGICYGHGLSEINNWYEDEINFVYENNPWFVRGGHYSFDFYTGVFDFSHTAGHVADAISTRSVLLLDSN